MTSIRLSHRRCCGTRFGAHHQHEPDCRFRDVAKARRALIKAARALEEATAALDATSPPPAPKRAPTPAQAAGGHARAATLTPERRREIARAAAKGRWNKE